MCGEGLIWLTVPSNRRFGQRYWCFHSVVSDTSWPYGLQPARFLCPWDSPGKNTRVGSHPLLQEIIPTQGSNLGLLHCMQIFFLPSEPPRKPGLMLQSYITVPGWMWVCGFKHFEKNNLNCGPQTLGAVREKLRIFATSSRPSWSRSRAWPPESGTVTAHVHQSDSSCPELGCF